MEPEPEATPQLAECLVCGLDFVSPLAWDERDDDRWLMVLRCGACDTVVELVASGEQVDQYCGRYDRQLRRLAAAARRLERERMTADLETFVAALEHGLICADDFAR